MRFAVISLLVVGGLAGCSEDPAARWVGVYRGSFLSEAVDCATGEALDPVTATIEVRVVAYRGGIAIDGACPVELQLTGDTTARVEPGECESTLSDGTPVRYERLRGEAWLDGVEFSLDASTRTHADGVCDSSHDTFVGVRVD